MKENYIDNPAALKIDLMLRGLRIDDPLVRAWACGMDGVDIMLPRNTLVNIPCREEFTKGSPYVLRKKGGGYAITDGRGEVAAELVKRPAFYDRKTSTGVPFSRIATVHGSLTSIAPSSRCDFFNASVECKYCAGNLDVKGADKTIYSVEEVVETVEAVLEEGVGGLIYLSTGFSEGTDGGIVFLKPYLHAIKRKFRCLVAVETLPPRENRWIDETYALGADSVLYNLEIFDKELYEIICPGRAASIGRKRCMDALAYAARIFPNGTVASHLIVGLEPPGSTMQGIDYLTGIGAVPILPIYRPRPGKALRIDPLTTEIILPVYKHLYRAVTEKKISLTWVRDLSMVTTPAEIRALVDDAGTRPSIVESFYKSRLGRKTAWGLSSLRRKLRVKASEGGEEGE
ncbi:MAG: radical SAM protein [Deltaproteobacteria bacterium]|nr:radical SAM protein [Deltaproteobacteria bacterium]